MKHSVCTVADHLLRGETGIELAKRLKSIKRDVPIMQLRALLVDDEPNILLTLGLVLEAEGFHLQTAESAEVAKSYLLNADFDLVVTDLSLEHPLSGFEIVRLARQKPVRPSTIVISAFYDDLAAWNQHGADAGLPKPTDIEKLLKTIGRLLSHSASESGKKIALGRNRDMVGC